MRKVQSQRAEICSIKAEIDIHAHERLGHTEQLSRSLFGLVSGKHLLILRKAFLGEHLRHDGMRIGNVKITKRSYVLYGIKDRKYPFPYLTEQRNTVILLHGAVVFEVQIRTELHQLRDKILIKRTYVENDLSLFKGSFAQREGAVGAVDFLDFSKAVTFIK